jgi:hypothetical protein
MAHVRHHVVQELARKMVTIYVQKKERTYVVWNMATYVKQRKENVNQVVDKEKLKCIANLYAPRHGIISAAWKMMLNAEPVKEHVKPRVSLVLMNMKVKEGCAQNKERQNAASKITLHAELKMAHAKQHLVPETPHMKSLQFYAPKQETLNAAWKRMLSVRLRKVHVWLIVVQLMTNYLVQLYA